MAGIMGTTGTIGLALCGPCADVGCFLVAAGGAATEEGVVGPVESASEGA